MSVVAFCGVFTSYSYSIRKHCIRGIRRYIAAFSLQYLFADLFIHEFIYLPLESAGAVYNWKLWRQYITEVHS